MKTTLFYLKKGHYHLFKNDKKTIAIILFYLICRYYECQLDGTFVLYRNDQFEQEVLLSFLILSVLNDNFEISDIIYAFLLITRFKRNIIFVTQDTPIHDVLVRLQYVLERIFSQLTSAIPGRLSIFRYAKIKH